MRVCSVLPLDVCHSLSHNCDPLTTASRFCLTSVTLGVRVPRPRPRKTGDKEETAINIGLSCKLLHSSMKVVLLNAEDVESFKQQLAVARSELRNGDQWSPGVLNDNLGVVIQGHCLQHVLGNGKDSARPHRPKPKSKLNWRVLFGT